jgi:hypothetical protein
MAFTHLTTLRVALSLWFNNAILFPNAPIDGYVYKRENRLACQIHTLLPPSLKELEIQFMWPDVVFAKRANYHAQFPTTPARIQIKGCEWFMDLLQHGNELPALERLSLVEVVDVYDRQNDTLLPRAVTEENVREKYTVRHRMWCSWRLIMRVWSWRSSFCGSEGDINPDIAGCIPSGFSE